MHETGHYVAAKVMKLRIEKAGFTYKPFPRFYVSIIDNGISFQKRGWFLISGNLMTFVLFFIYLSLFSRYDIVYYVFSYQLIVETNPFYSDYTTIIFSYFYKDDFKRQFEIQSSPDSDQTDKDYKENYKNKYLFGKLWYLHFLVWGIFIIGLLSPVISTSHK